MRNLLLLSLVLVGCSSSSNNNTPDAAVTPDAPAAKAPDCTTYCNTIMANCTTTNGAAQYADMAHCLGSCSAFTIGTSTVNDQAGDTLGCRIYHANAAAGSTANAVLHCPHAGPGGDLLSSATTTPAYCSGGDFCTNFCSLEIATCGSTDAPVTVGGVAITPQYKNLAACVSVCKNGDSTVTPAIPAFDVTHPYATTSAGNSLACRLNHWTNAASGTVDPVNGGLTKTHCGHTGAAQTTGLPCSATTPTP